jgi:hypothetical protein
MEILTLADMVAPAVGDGGTCHMVASDMYGIFILLLLNGLPLLGFASLTWILGKCPK